MMHVSGIIFWAPAWWQVPPQLVGGRGPHCHNAKPLVTLRACRALVFPLQDYGSLAESTAAYDDDGDDGEEGSGRGASSVFARVAQGRHGSQGVDAGSGHGAAGSKAAAAAAGAGPVAPLAGAGLEAHAEPAAPAAIPAGQQPGGSESGGNQGSSGTDSRGGVGRSRVPQLVLRSSNSTIVRHLAGAMARSRMRAHANTSASAPSAAPCTNIHARGNSSAPSTPGGSSHTAMPFGLADAADAPPLADSPPTPRSSFARSHFSHHFHHNHSASAADELRSRQADSGQRQVAAAEDLLRRAGATLVPGKPSSKQQQAGA